MLEPTIANRLRSVRTDLEKRQIEKRQKEYSQNQFLVKQKPDVLKKLSMGKQQEKQSWSRETSFEVKFMSNKRITASDSRNFKIVQLDESLPNRKKRTNQLRFVMGLLLVLKFQGRINNDLGLSKAD